MLLKQINNLSKISTNNKNNKKFSFRSLSPWNFQIISEWLVIILMTFFFFILLLIFFWNYFQWIILLLVVLLLLFPNSVELLNHHNHLMDMRDMGMFSMSVYPSICLRYRQKYVRTFRYRLLPIYHHVRPFAVRLIQETRNRDRPTDQNLLIKTSTNK